MAMKLGYWKIRGLAQAIRLEMKYLGLDFTDEFYVQGPAPDFDSSSWFGVKETLGLDFPDLPYLVDGDMKMTQTWAIMRYVARKAGKLVPKTEAETVAVDMCEGAITDLRRALSATCYSPKYLELREGFLKKAATWLMRFSSYLKGKKWLAGNNLTFVDFTLYELLDVLRIFEASLLEPVPDLKAYMTEFEALPGMKEYLKSEQCMKTPCNNTIARWSK
nr:glutathione S-transferase mu-like [Halisarca dujardinii]